MSPLEMRGRPGGRSQAADVSAANLDTSSLLELERHNEIKRRARLRRDLNRVADRLDQFDKPAAALARYFAEVAA
jgi:hypothetical protein